MNKNKPLITIFRILVGLLFIFSGFMKANDPTGSQIKIEEYLLAYGTHWLVPLSLFGAIFFISLEFITGICILIGLKMKIISPIALALMAFFTIQTFTSAVWNLVSDCGCFGDCFKLTNWMTFYKNLILITLVIFIFIERKNIKSLFNDMTEWVLLSLITLCIVFFTIHCYRNLPPIDCLPYKVGNDIGKLMTIPDNAPRDEFKTTLLYKNKKSGEVKEFTMANIPSDKDWEWKDTKNVLIKKGYQPPIHDFNISDSTGNDITQDFLNQKGYRLIIVQVKLSESNVKGQKRLNDLISSVSKLNTMKVWTFTSSLKKESESYKKLQSAPYTYYNVDQTTLKTIIRSNPGLILMKDNVIIKKWPSRSIPDIVTLQKLINK